MLLIDNILVSEDIADVNFVCDLKKCRGACCVEGDAGAPLEEEEIGELEASVEGIKPYLTESGRKEIDRAGVFDYDSEGDYVTPLVNGRECAFAIFDEDGVASCGIEKAFENGDTELRKPVSCHLYPVRIHQTRYHEALNYHKWTICDPACKLGEELQVPIYKFVGEALIRKYGEAWYEKLTHEIESKSVAAERKYRY